jgi:LCP family protein required for cell wall assembly
VPRSGGDDKSSRHSDPNDPDSGMISVRDLVQRVERDSAGAGGGTMFPSGSIPRAPRPTPPSRGHGKPVREPATEVIPVIKAPIAEPAEPADPAPTSPQPRATLRTKAARTVAGVCALLVLVGTGYGWSFLRSNTHGFTEVVALDEDSSDPSADATGSAQNYLVVGFEQAAGAAQPTTNADTVLLMSVPADRSRVVTVSFPADLEVARPSCQGWDPTKAAYTAVTYPPSDHEKLQDIYSLGGPKCLVQAVQKVSGMAVNHFLGVDLAGVAAMVDSIGGITVCSKTAVLDGDLGPILPDPGAHRIDGKTARNYLAARHVESDTHGSDRLRRTQGVVSGLLDAAWTSRVLLHPGTLHGFLTAFTHHSLVSAVDMKGLIALDRSLEQVGPDAMTFVALPTTTGSDGAPAPFGSAATALFAAIIGNTALPTAPLAPPAPSPGSSAAQVAVDPSTATVEVYNGTGRSGVGSTVANRLGKYGFSVAGTEVNPDGTSDTTVIRYGPGQAAAAATLASAVPDARLERASGSGVQSDTIDLILGADFSGSLQSPTPAGQTITGSSSLSAPAMPVAPPPNTPALDRFSAADNACQ